MVQKSWFQTLAFVKRDKRNHLTSFVSIKGSVNFSSFNVDNKHGIDVGPTTNPAAVTDTIPVKTGKKLYSIVATNAESLLDIHFQLIIRIIWFAEKVDSTKDSILRKIRFSGEVDYTKNSDLRRINENFDSPKDSNFRKVVGMSHIHSKCEWPQPRTTTRKKTHNVVDKTHPIISAGL